MLKRFLKIFMYRQVKTYREILNFKTAKLGITLRQLRQIMCMCMKTDFAIEIEKNIG